jgi:hypothetical protein
MNLFELTESYTRILGLIKSVDDNDISQVSIFFSNRKKLIISINIDTDELNFQIYDIEEEIISCENEFSYLINCKLIRSWIMSNHKDYQDALQIEVVEDSFEIGYIIQFIAEASSIQIFKLDSLN